MNSIDKVIKSFKLELKDIYSIREINAIIEVVLEHFLAFSKTDLILKVNQTITYSEFNKFEKTLLRLKNNEPIQYILGETFFYNFKLKVTPSVLIPRQETEELTDWIIKQNSSKEHLQILDIGTGSGCIAISLAGELKNSSVTAFDVSESALKIASNNAELNHVNINFQKVDILKASKHDQNIFFDIIVSNPPYVLEKEKNLMHRNVLDFEPSLALFVEDKDPLLFYRAIVEYSSLHLKAFGILYFEINEAYGKQIEELLLKSNFEQVELRKDINGKNRMISGIKIQI